MSRKSSIEQLPSELRLKLIELLNDPKVTQKEVTELINDQAGTPVVSKSAVNRYAQKMQRQIEKTKQAREVAETYISQLGEDTSNKMGKVLNEQLRLIAYDLITEISDMREAKETTPALLIDLLFKVSRGLKTLEEAEHLNIRRADKIKKEAMEAAASKTEKTLKENGLPDETIFIIKKELLGVDD